MIKSCIPRKRVGAEAVQLRVGIGRTDPFMRYDIHEYGHPGRFFAVNNTPSRDEAGTRQLLRPFFLSSAILVYLINCCYYCLSSSLQISTLVLFLTQETFTRCSRASGGPLRNQFVDSPPEILPLFPKSGIVEYTCLTAAGAEEFVQNRGWSTGETVSDVVVSYFQYHGRSGPSSSSSLYLSETLH